MRSPIYHTTPGASQEEFDVMNWLSTEGLSQKGIDRFLKLQYASTGMSYVSALKITDHYFIIVHLLR